MNIEELAISNLSAVSRVKAPVISDTKTSRAFSSILRASAEKHSLSVKASWQTNAQSQIGSPEGIGQLTETELEDKYCSICGSRIKEDGTCPICIVPIFISGNPHIPASGAL